MVSATLLPMNLARSSRPIFSEEDLENQEWIESLEDIIRNEGPKRATEILEIIQKHAEMKGIQLPVHVQTPYINTIHLNQQPTYPGQLEIERRIENLIRWNAMAMVVRANRQESGIGGHISTFASCSTLYEVGFNHFFHGKNHKEGGDFIYFQGHAAPGNYARAYLEERLTEDQLLHFRREIHFSEGLSSYPHPYLMPKFWEFPTVSMGLGPIQSIYRARFMRYLENRKLKSPSRSKVWCFIGDGECDEPETLGAITLAPREHLDNLIFVVNCNLQRLDGPVRGNGKIIQELETIFRGVGWNVIKVLWGSDWDPLFAKDTDGVLQQRLTETLDGEFLKYRVENGSYIRKHLFGKDPRLQNLAEPLSDTELKTMKVGGHDPVKVYSAYLKAVQHSGSPTVILAQTIKGYGLGEAGEGKNITHQQKKLTEHELIYFRDQLGLSLSDQEVFQVPFQQFKKESVERKYLLERRKELGGFLPERRPLVVAVPPPKDEIFDEFLHGYKKDTATTMILVRLLSRLLNDPALGKHIVPIVPDEARTFGMETLFRQFGIYSSIGQLYEPVDRSNILYYRETREGQLIEEGITEAGSISSFIAAGTSYAEHGIPMLPFFFFYSMFGFQRIGDLIWAAGDSRTRGFLVGGTAGRTTLAGEGLQHQDGHSHILAQPLPNLVAYDPAFAYEIAIIVKDGIRRMLEKQEDIIYYLTVGNEPYAQPEMPNGGTEGILRGIYPYGTSSLKHPLAKVDLFGSGALIHEVIKAQEILFTHYEVESTVWSVTSYKELRREALEVERWNLLHPSEAKKIPFLTQVTQGSSGIYVAVSDYMKILPDSIAKWLPGQLLSLGTDGFGRSDTRNDLREHFEVNYKYIVLSALTALVSQKKVDPNLLQRADSDLKIQKNKTDPMQL
jgi:pyruvate dehydrogenase E1 component